MNSNFEHAPFEKDLRDFSKEIKEYQAENKIESLQKKHVKDFLKSRLGQPSISVRTKTPAPTSVLDESKILPDYLISESAQIKSKVEELIGLVFAEGVERAAKKASKSGPFILDAFHDALTAKLYEELKKRGLVK